MTLRVTQKKTATLSGTSLSVGEMRRLLEGVSDGATIDIHYYQAASRDPREHSYATLDISEPTS